MSDLLLWCFEVINASTSLAFSRLTFPEDIFLDTKKAPAN